jgi:hypothetical protein
MNEPLTDDKIRVLFLDVDGVLNSHQSIMASIRSTEKESGPDGWFCPIACSNLLEILARIPDLKIVVSSSWRIGRDLPGIRRDLKPAGIPDDRIIGMTPVNRALYRWRGMEIEAYLKARPEIGDFVIVDDDSDMKPFMHRLVQTDTRMGLMWDKAHEILKRFGADDEPKGILL